MVGHASPIQLSASKALRPTVQRVTGCLQPAPRRRPKNSASSGSRHLGSSALIAGPVVLRVLAARAEVSCAGPQSLPVDRVSLQVHERPPRLIRTLSDRSPSLTKSCRSRGSRTIRTTSGARARQALSVDRPPRRSPRRPRAGAGGLLADAGNARDRRGVGPARGAVHTNLAAAYAQAGKMDEAKAELAEGRRLNPAITIKWMKEHTPKSSGSVRRPPQGGTAGGMRETKSLASPPPVRKIASARLKPSA